MSLVSSASITARSASPRAELSGAMEVTGGRGTFLDLENDLLLCSCNPSRAHGAVVERGEVAAENEGRRENGKHLVYGTRTAELPASRPSWPRGRRALLLPRCPRVRCGQGWSPHVSAAEKHQSTGQFAGDGVEKHCGFAKKKMRRPQSVLAFLVSCAEPSRTSVDKGTEGSEKLSCEGESDASRRFQCNSPSGGCKKVVAVGSIHRGASIGSSIAPLLANGCRNRGDRQPQ